MKLPFSTPILMESSLSLDEIVRRLRQQVGSPIQFLAFLGRGPRIVGRVGEDRFWLRYSNFYNNSFQRRLTLVIDSSASGSTLCGKFACSTPVLAFSGVWFAFVVLMNIAWVVSLARGAVSTSRDPMWFNFLPAGMMLFGVLLFWFGLWLSSKTETKVIAFVEQALDARIVSTLGVARAQTL